MMPLENDGDGGGSSGGGSTTSICTVNPSDNVAILNNLISRISDIERFLSQLVGADVHADNLSELADNIGNILNGTIMLPGDGNSPWAGEGGSIPVPDDFNGTVISGNVITTWTNGVVSFQVIPSSGITVGGGGGVSSYLVVQPTTTVLSSNHPDLQNIITNVGSAFGTSNLNAGRVDILEDGYYHASMQFSVNWSTTGSKRMEVVTFTIAVRDVIFNNNQDTRQFMSADFGFPASAGEYLEITFNGISALASQYLYSVLTIEKLA